MKKQYFLSLLAMLLVGFILSGQQLVSDINTSGGSDPNFFTEYDGLLFFSADDGINGRELWAYDPNTLTSSLILDINPGSGSSNPSGLYVFDGKLVFGTDYNSELNVYDRQVMPATLNSYPLVDVGTFTTTFNKPRNYKEYGGDLWFSAVIDATNRGYLLKFDGINISWRQIGSTSTYTPPIGQSSLALVGDNLYFEGRNTNNEAELFVLNLATDTVSVENIGSSTVDGNIQEIAALASNRLVLSGRISNGTSTRLVLFDPATSAKSYISSSGVSPTDFGVVDEALYFSAQLSSINTEREFYRYEPGTGPTINLDINPTGGSNPQLFTELNGTIFFRANNGTTGVELHYYNHSTGEFGPLFDLNPGSASSTPKGIIAFNNELYFGADDGSGTGFELWKYDGSLPCPVPSNVSVSNISFFDADISWTGSTDAQDGYQWYVMAQGEVPNQGGATPAASGTVPNGTTTASASGLDFNTNYDVYVEALCSVTSTSALSSVASFTTLSCESVTNLATTNITDTSVSVSWTASATAFNGYNWYLMNPGEIPGQDTVLDTGVVTTTDVTVTGLTASTTYDLYIQSRCATGFGSALSTFVSFTTTASCDAPTNLTTTNITTSSLDLSWTASPDAANGYRWYILPSGSTDTAQAIETNVTTAASVNVNASNLTAGTSYDAYVVSRCSATLNSGLSVVETFTVPSPIPLITISGPISLTEGGDIILTLTASQQATQNINIELSFGGTADNTNDYAPAGNTATIVTGFTSTNFTIATNDDSVLEPLENIIVDIISVTNGLEDGVQQLEVLIEDNESSLISFTNSGQALATFATDVILGDFDANQGLDALISKANASDRVFFNNGTGTLLPPSPVQSIGSGNETVQMAVGNFDGNGDNDVVLAKRSLNQVILNNGTSGIFTDSGLPFGSGTNYESVATEDLDGNGLDDIIAGRDGLIEVYTNDYITNGFILDFSLSQTLNFGTSLSQVTDMKVSDINQDTNFDLVVATEQSSYVFYGTAGGQFNTVPVVLPNNMNATGVDIVDIDNNGFKDFVFSQGPLNGSNSANQIVLNNGSSGFILMPLTPIATGSYTDAVFVDLDNDGDKDVVFSGNVNTYWENTGGAFANNGFTIPSATNASFALDAGDIDGDGDMDIIYANTGTATSRIWFNNLLTLSNDDFEPNRDVRLYPNPVKNEFIIKTQNSEIEKVEIFNLQGQLVKLFKPSGSYNISDLESGLYFVSIKSVKANAIIKIVKQ